MNALMITSADDDERREGEAGGRGCPCWCVRCAPGLLELICPRKWLVLAGWWIGGVSDESGLLGRNLNEREGRRERRTEMCPTRFCCKGGGRARAGRVASGERRAAREAREAREARACDCDCDAFCAARPGGHTNTGSVPPRFPRLPRALSKGLHGAQRRSPRCPPALPAAAPLSSPVRTWYSRLRRIVCCGQSEGPSGRAGERARCGSVLTFRLARKAHSLEWLFGGQIG